MNRRTFYFGPIGHMKYVKMMQPGMPFSPVGYSESSQYLSGRKGMRRSLGSHREYDFTWRGSQADVQHILDCAGGMYGPGPFYFIDPMWAERNVLPAHWATPSVGAQDAPPIYGEDRPSASPMPGNDGTWPAEGALFRYDTNADPIDVYIPIPPGHTFHFWYTGTAGAVTLAAQSGAVSGVESTPTAADPASTLTAQTPASVVATDSINGVRIKLALSSTLTTATIYGMRGVVIPSGRSVTSLPESGFVGGQGHSGCDFENHPSVTPYSSRYGSLGVSARLIEVDR